MHAVADPLLGKDILRLLGARLDLVTQGSNVHAEVLDFTVAAPELAQDEAVRQNLAGMHYEQAEQVVLARRQLHLDASAHDDPAHKVDRQLAAAKDRGFALLLQSMTQRRPD